MEITGTLASRFGKEVDLGDTQESRETRQEEELEVVQRRLVTSQWGFLFSDAVIVAYSGGKDSLACMELASRAGKRIEAYFMYFLPGMDYTRHWVEYAWSRWRVKVREYLHPSAVEFLRQGTFAREAVELKTHKHTDVERIVRSDTGLRWIVYGYKSCDSIERNAMMKSWPDGVNHKRGLVAPLQRWTTRNVRGFLTVAGIPYEEPDERKKTNGLDLTPRSLSWLKSDWPADYRRILNVFPFAAAQVDRVAHA